MKDGKRKGIIVVSDTHIGSEQFNYDEFCEFLAWIASLSNKPKTIQCQEVLDEAGNARETTIQLKTPEKLILLGDILEFWDPLCQNRDFILAYSGEPFALLEKLPCKKLYVVGNHDEDLSELHKTLAGGKEDNTKSNSKYLEELLNLWKKLLKLFRLKCQTLDTKESLESIFLNKLKFEIYNRHYPPKNEDTDISHGVRVGVRTYFFMHGHQFDKWQIFKNLSGRLHIRIDPIDYFQDLANVSFTKEIYRNPLAFLFFVLAFGLSVYVYSFHRLLLLSSPFFFALYLILASFVVMSLLPKLVTSFQRKVWDRLFKVKDKSVQEVVEGSFTTRPDKIYADVVVFGHTHFADKHLLPSGWKLRGLRRIKKLFGRVRPEEEGRKKLFVNSGCWVNKDDKVGNAERKVNTFAYIDETGIYLFKWKGKGDIDCLTGFSFV